MRGAFITFQRPEGADFPKKGIFIINIDNSRKSSECLSERRPSKRLQGKSDGNHTVLLPSHVRHPVDDVMCGGRRAIPPVHGPVHVNVNGATVLLTVLMSGAPDVRIGECPSS